MEYTLGVVTEITKKDVEQYEYLRCSTDYQPPTRCQATGYSPASLAVQLIFNLPNIFVIKLRFSHLPNENAVQVSVKSRAKVKIC